MLLDAEDQDFGRSGRCWVSAGKKAQRCVADYRLISMSGVLFVAEC